MKTKFLLFVCMLYLGVNIVSCNKDNHAEPLQADFTVSSRNVRAGEQVVFQDSSSGDISRWNWTFQGASQDTSSLSSPSVSFDTPGKYAVSLTVSNSSGSSSITKEEFITVGYNQVVAAFQANKNIIVQGDEVSFSDQSTGLIEHWDWEFTSTSGDRFVVNEQNPQIAFTKIGIYTVKLTVSNPEFANAVTKESYITVLDPSSISVDFSASLTGTIEGGSITFTPSSVGSVENWQWEFEGGNPSVSTSNNPVVTYPKAGRYKVKLTGINGSVNKQELKEGYIVVMPKDKIAAYFPFGGDLSDAGPNQFTPEIRGTVTTLGLDRHNRDADASVFNGSGGLLLADHPALNFGTNDYTVSVWVKTNQSTRMMIWQESGDKGSKDNQTWMRLGANTTTQLLGFATEDAAGGSFIGLSELEGGKLYDNVWHHVVCIRQGLKTTVYIDGIKRKELSSSSGIKAVSNNAPFKIGMQGGATGFSNYFNGMLDDLVIYNKALSESEVIALRDL